MIEEIIKNGNTNGLMIMLIEWQKSSTPNPTVIKQNVYWNLRELKLKKLIENITGQNNLNYMNNKIYGSDDLCRFCEEEDETFDHLIIEWPCFYLDWVDLLQNQPILNTTDWNPKTLLKFAKIDAIKNALCYNCLLYTSPSPRD